VAVAVAGGAAAVLAVDIAETVLIQVVGQLVAGVIGAALAPELDAIQAASWTLVPGRRLSPADAAVAQVKGHLAPAVAADEARASGIAGDRFAVLVAAAGNPPPSDYLLQLARRGIIPIADDKGAASTSAEQGIRESFLHDKWLSVLEEGQWQLPSLGAVIEARLRNFITPDQFNVWTHYLGYKSDAAGLEFLAAGVPLSPQEGYVAYHRGLIPLDSPDPNVPSLKQVFRESRIIDKYIDVWVDLQQYRPPPRTITALHRAGAINDAQALKAYKDEGLTDEWAAIYVATAHHERTAATKELTVAQLRTMYIDGALTRADFVARLEGLGFGGASAELEVGYADLVQQHALTAKATNRIGTLYVGRRISKDDALAALKGLKLANAQTDQLLQTWDLERAVSVKHLTPAQLAASVAAGWVDTAEALNELVAEGYGPRDAWILLAEHKVKDLGPAPPPENVPPL
jgi:hypothetical protein